MMFQYCKHNFHIDLIKRQEFKLKIESNSSFFSEILMLFPNSGLVNKEGTD